MTPVILIPARAGSTRIRGKNMKPFAGWPLLWWTVQAARACQVTDTIICSTDDPSAATLCIANGIEPVLRPDEYAGATSPDIEWVRHLYTTRLDTDQHRYAILLRPTAPFRRPETIRSAWRQYSDAVAARPTVHSLRAVTKAGEHPGKMWRLSKTRRSMRPLLGSYEHVSQPTQTLEPVYVQNASLEIFDAQAVLETGLLSGRSVIPYLSIGMEGFDINTPLDWLTAELLVEKRIVQMPTYVDARIGS